MTMRRRGSAFFLTLFALAVFVTAGSGQAPTAAANAVSPLSFKIGSFDFMPGGFIDFTTLWRSTDVGSGITTNFAAIPYNNTTAGRVGELRESAQYSRLSLKASGNHGDLSLMGYFEGDFLGNQPANIAVTANSGTFRMRVYFADIKSGNWEVVAGQNWSLLTPNRFGASPIPGDIFYSLDEDPNFQVGLAWARQPQLRVIYHSGGKFTAAFSAENPEQYVGGSAGSATIVLPGGPNGVYAPQVNNGASSYASPGFSPDFIGKLAYDSGKAAGQGVHLELTGIESTFRVFTPSTGATDRAAGAGFSANAIAGLTPGLRVIATDFIGDGGGRYFQGMAPDFIIRQNGSVSPVRSSGGVLGFEAPVTPAWQLYGYYGGVLVARNYDASATLITGGPSPVGYGYSGSANTNNKSIQEGTVGFIDTFFKSATDGTLQLITQGAYISRAPWFVAAGTPKNAHADMIYVDLRYVLP